MTIEELKKRCSAILKREMDNFKCEVEPEVFNIDSFFLWVTFQEIKEELAFLEHSLQQDAFTDLFAERCSLRAQLGERYLGFDLAPNSFTNRLYAQLAKEVGPFLNKKSFYLLSQREKILTVDDSILIPNPGITATNKKKYIIKLISKEQLVFEMAEDINPDELSHFTSDSNFIFDLRQIANYPLDLHIQIYELLQRQYPTLAEAVYSHNSSFRLLKAKIQRCQSSYSPQQMIQHLINEFKLGGETMTGRAEASITAVLAYQEFKDYFNQLPEEHKAALLSASNSKLRMIFAHLNAGECIEKASEYLQELLSANEANPYFTKEINLSTVERQAFVRYYRRRHLDTEKEIDFTKIPAYYLAALSLLSLESIEDLTFYLLDFPTVFYNRLLANPAFKTVLFKELFSYIGNNFFSNEQEIALIEALKNAINNRERAFKRSAVLAFALKIEDLALFQSTLDKLYPSDIAHFFKTGILTVEGLQEKPSFFMEAFKALQLKDRISLIKESAMAVPLKRSCIHYAVLKNHQFLAEILVFITKPPERMELLLLKDEHKNTAFHLAVNFPLSLKVLLQACLYDNNILWALNNTNNLNQTPLSLALKKKDALKIIFLSLNTRSKNRLLETKIAGGSLLAAALEEDSFPLILAQYADEYNRYKALLKSGQHESSVFVKALNRLKENQSTREIVDILTSFTEARYPRQLLDAYPEIRNLSKNYPELQNILINFPKASSVRAKIRESKFTFIKRVDCHSSLERRRSENLERTAEMREQRMLVRRHSLAAMDVDKANTLVAVIQNTMF